MARRRAVMWATGLSLALVLGSALIALGAGAFAEPPVDRAGSFAAISAEFSPSPAAPTASATGPSAASHPPAGSPGPPDDASPTTRPPGARPIAPPTAPSAVAPSGRHEVESPDATPGRAGTTTTSAAALWPPATEPEKHDAPQHDTDASEPPEHEPDD